MKRRVTVIIAVVMMFLLCVTVAASTLEGIINNESFLEHGQGCGHCVDINIPSLIEIKEKLISINPDADLENTVAVTKEEENYVDRDYFLSRGFSEHEVNDIFKLNEETVKISVTSVEFWPTISMFSSNSCRPGQHTDIIKVFDESYPTHTQPHSNNCAYIYIVYYACYACSYTGSEFFPYYGCWY